MSNDKWKKRELADVATFFSGGTPSKSNADYWGGGIPWITVRDMKQMFFSGSGLSLSEKGATRLRMMPAGTIYILVRGMGLFKDLPVLYCDRPATFNQDIKALAPRDSVSAEFLAYSLIARKTEILRLVDSAGHGTGRLDTDLLKSVPIMIPPPSVQNKVVRILRTWDEAIEKLDALIAKSEKQHAALIRSLVFGEKRMECSAESERQKKYRWFTLPADWQCKQIGKMAREISARNRGADNAEILSCSKYDGFVRSLEYFKKQVYSTDLTGYKVVRRGDFGFPSNHVEEGSIGLQNVVDVGLVSPIYTVFRFSSEVIDNEYAYYVLKTGSFRHIFETSTSASVDRRGSLRWNEFSKIPFPVPPLTEQQEIVRILNTSAKKIVLLYAERSSLERQKRGLMLKLLTGQWKVTR